MAPGHTMPREAAFRFGLPCPCLSIRDAANAGTVLTGRIFCCRSRDAAILWEQLGAVEFLWCCTLQGKFPRKSSDDDLVEWELNVPEASVLAFISALAWEGMVSGGAEKWDALFIRNRPIEVASWRSRFGVSSVTSRKRNVPRAGDRHPCKIQVIHNGDVVK